MIEKMPERQSGDGFVDTTIGDDGNHLMLTAITCNVPQMLHISMYNAVRLMAALSLILDIPLDKKVSKIIKFDVGN